MAIFHETFLKIRIENLNFFFGCSLEILVSIYSFVVSFHFKRVKMLVIEVAQVPAIYLMLNFINCFNVISLMFNLKDLI